MKRLILLLALAFVMCGCAYRVGDTSVGKRMPVPIEKGSTRLTITIDYIIVETCKGNNSFGNPFWECDKIINIDSTRQEPTLKELIRKIKEQ